MSRQKLSVVLITLNAERALEACLASVPFADEIVMVDSGSTDQTLALAEKYQARVVQQTFLGFGPQKQFAVEQANNDWVLCLDADERVSPELRDAILQVLEDPQQGAYQMPRCNRFMGRWLRYGEGYPDLSLRLFNRNQARWSDDRVHEYVIAPSRVGLLQGDLMHESEDGIADYLSKQNRYTSLQAQALFERGKRAGVAKLILSPALRFIKFYFLRRGFLDGLPGLVHILVGCFNSFSKYAKLNELHRRA